MRTNETYTKARPSLQTQQQQQYKNRRNRYNDKNHMTQPQITTTTIRKQKKTDTESKRT